jgi:hypothetical protein
MPTTKYTGKNLKMDWVHSSGGTVSLDATTRTFEVTEQASEVDLSTRDDAAANSSFVLPGIPKRTAKAGGLSNSGGTTPQWDVAETQISQGGTIFWYSQGNTSGKPKRQAAATILNRSNSSPYDGGEEWTLDFTFTSDITRGTVP